MALTASDGRLLEKELSRNRLTFDNLWGPDTSPLPARELGRLRAVMREMTDTTSRLDSALSTEGLHRQLEKLHLSEGAVTSIYQHLTQDFQTYFEAAALARVAKGDVGDLCKCVFDYYAQPISQSQFRDVMHSRFSLGVTAADAIATLLFKHWRWTAWWRNPMEDVRPLFADRWGDVEEQLATAFAYTRSVTEELRWVLLMKELETIKEQLSDLQTRFATLPVRDSFSTGRPER